MIYLNTIGTRHRVNSPEHLRELPKNLRSIEFDYLPEFGCVYHPEDTRHSTNGIEHKLTPTSEEVQKGLLPAEDYLKALSQEPGIETAICDYKRDEELEGEPLSGEEQEGLNNFVLSTLDHDLGKRMIHTSFCPQILSFLKLDGLVNPQQTGLIIRPELNRGLFSRLGLQGSSTDGEQLSLLNTEVHDYINQLYQNDGLGVLSLYHGLEGYPQLIESLTSDRELSLAFWTIRSLSQEQEVKDRLDTLEDPTKSRINNVFMISEPYED